MIMLQCCSFNKGRAPPPLSTEVDDMVSFTWWNGAGLPSLLLHVTIKNWTVGRPGDNGYPRTTLVHVPWCVGACTLAKVNFIKWFSKRVHQKNKRLITYFISEVCSWRWLTLQCRVCKLQYHIPYSGKLSREKTFANFVVLWLFAKVFSVKFGGVVSFGTAQASNPQKFSPRKSPSYESFLPRKFSAIRYYTGTWFTHNFGRCSYILQSCDCVCIQFTHCYYLVTVCDCILLLSQALLLCVWLCTHKARLTLGSVTWGRKWA